MAISRSDPRSYSIAVARNQLSQLVRQAEKEGPVQLSRRGKPVAVILSLEQFGELQGRRSFFDAVTAFREQFDLEALDIDPNEVFAGVEDRSQGREFTW